MSLRKYMDLVEQNSRVVELTDEQLDQLLLENYGELDEGLRDSLKKAAAAGAIGLAGLGASVPAADAQAQTRPQIQQVQQAAGKQQVQNYENQFGMYSGTLVNGKMHGSGTLNFGVNDRNNNTVGEVYVMGNFHEDKLAKQSTFTLILSPPRGGDVDFPQQRFNNLSMEQTLDQIAAWDKNAEETGNPTKAKAAQAQPRQATAVPQQQQAASTQPSQQAATPPPPARDPSKVKDIEFDPDLSKRAFAREGFFDHRSPNFQKDIEIGGSNRTALMMSWRMGYEGYIANIQDGGRFVKAATFWLVDRGTGQKSYLTINYDPRTKEYSVRSMGSQAPDPYKSIADVNRKSLLYTMLQAIYSYGS